jgi:DegV family protein with EDD domain
MPSYKIITDSACDLPQEVREQLDLKCIPLFVNFRGQMLPDSVDGDIQELYNGWRNWESASTSAANPEHWAAAMEDVLKADQDVLVIAFSSGLSTTYQSAVIAAADMAEKYPQRKIRVVDSLSASMGQGLLVWYACKKRDEGLSLEELVDWCENNKQNVAQWFTVDDLMYLKRGGRISAATALMGTMLNIKPVLHVDEEGHLISKIKARGRKASIQTLAKKVGEIGMPGQNDLVFISHGDCEEDAKTLAEILKKDYGVKEVLIGYVGAVIGSHSGPGTLAMFFMAEHR